MDHPGERLRRVRERLKLTYRQVAEASRRIAERRGNREFGVGISRLADIENQGKVPTIFRLYSLCAIYKLDLDEVLGWYGVPTEQVASDALHTGLAVTHTLDFSHASTVSVPHLTEAGFDPKSTVYVSELIRRWGKMPFTYLNGVEAREFRYGWIGLEDWSMYPVLHPGSVVAIDDNRRKIARDGWTTEYDRPIYFLEQRDGFRCGWCTVEGTRLIVEPHPGSHQAAAVFEWPREIDVVGQVVGVAMMLRRRKRPARP
ncbi:MAG TPA: helix-turn-helix domain-containing protein [Bryobacteraceae bacterium]|nr:helix-turn-helix domain-containing protein [Bryobacteraceae bacterium]